MSLAAAYLESSSSIQGCPGTAAVRSAPESGSVGVIHLSLSVTFCLAAGERALERAGERALERAGEQLAKPAALVAGTLWWSQRT